MTEYFIQAFIYLCAAVIFVPIAKRLGLGSVLGYLIAGVIIGPSLGLVGQETETIQHFAEFGVAMMLFLVGLELEPRVLWDMRHRLIGLGGLQVSLTAIIVIIIALLVGLEWTYAVAIGLIFSLSSTAIVLQTFNEKGLNKAEGARTAFSVLLFQDIAVLPMLALIPLLAMPELVELANQGAATHGGGDGHQELSLVDNLNGVVYGLVVIGTIITLIVAGQFLSRPLFNFIAKTGLPEIFTTAALLLVIGTATLMSLLGLSPALGTFLAGVVLATSEFRHELESNIEPFKGLLLGLFFITVGAGIDFGVLQESWIIVGALVVAVMLIKAAVLYVLAIIFKVYNADRWLFTLSLAQAGEFGFVLLNYSSQNHVLPDSITNVLALVVAFSMFMTPGLFILFDKLILPSYAKGQDDREADNIKEQGMVVIAGIGRFGQVVNRLLMANNIKTVVLDHDAAQVELMSKVNVKSYYGDATRADLLHNAGIENAQLLVVAIDDKERALQLVRYMKKKYPKIKVLARAFDRRHMFQLEEAGADITIPEVFHSAIEASRLALMNVGVHPFRAEQLKSTFIETEQAHKQSLFNSWKEASAKNQFGGYRELFMALEEVLNKAMKRQRNDNHSRSERGWTPPPKGYDSDIVVDFEYYDQVDHSIEAEQEAKEAAEAKAVEAAKRAKLGKDG